MSPVTWTLTFLVILVGGFFALRALGKQEESADVKPLTRRAGLGWGIIALGALLLLMPWASSAIAMLDSIQSDAYTILLGAAYVLGILIVLAGLAVMLVKEEEEVA